MYLFQRKGIEGRKRERNIVCERYIDQLPLTHPPAGDLACNPGMCPDWESNRLPFSLQGGTQSTEPHQPGHPKWYFRCNEGKSLS